jgi:hypothetical protein
MVSLKSVINRLKHTLVSVGDLKQLIPPKTKVVHLKELKGKHRTEVFKGLRGIIVLLPSNVSKQGHYVTILPRRNHIEYWSSLGHSPAKEATLLHDDEGIIKNLLGKHFIYNRTRLQSGDFKIKTCAMFCVARLFLSDLKMRQFNSLFSRGLTANTPDDLIGLMSFMTFQDV